MKSSDRTLVREFWEYVLQCDWIYGKPCPRCDSPLSVVPLMHDGERHPVLGCKTCYHLILKEGTMAHFEKEKSEAKVRASDRERLKRRAPDGIDLLVNRLAEATEERWLVRIGKEGGGGREVQFAISVGGLILSVCAFLFLRQTGNAFHWGFLASACAFAVGLRVARNKAAEPAPPRELKEFGSGTLPEVRAAPRGVRRTG